MKTLSFVLGLFLTASVVAWDRPAPAPDADYTDRETAKHGHLVLTEKHLSLEADSILLHACQSENLTVSALVERLSVNCAELLVRAMLTLYEAEHAVAEAVQEGRGITVGVGFFDIDNVDAVPVRASRLATSIAGGISVVKDCKLDRSLALPGLIDREVGSTRTSVDAEFMLRNELNTLLTERSTDTAVILAEIVAARALALGQELTPQCTAP